MSRLIINPQKGSIQTSKEVKFEIVDIPENARIKVENGTDMIPVSITGEEEYIYPISEKYEGTMDLRLPEYSSQSAISIFANIEKKKLNGSYKLMEICPAVFYIEDVVASVFDGSVEISPHFVDYDGACSVKLESKPNDKFVFSINDRRISILSNKEGSGSIHFKPKDFLNIKEHSVIQRFPVYFYNSDDNFVKKNFTGLYLNILPSDIITHVSDPRCTDPKYMTDGVFDPTKWSISEECFDILGADIYSTVSRTICENSKIDVSSDKEICFFNKTSSTLLVNGMILHVYTGVDKSITDTNSVYYNKGRVFISEDNTTFEDNVIVGRNVALAPKTADEDIEVAVEEDIYDRVNILLETEIVKVIIFNEELGYGTFVIKSAIGPDEYGAYYRLLADKGTTEVEIKDWQFCQYAVFFEDGKSPVSDISMVEKVAYIESSADTISGGIVPAVNVAIGCNQDYIGDEGESYVYLVAEGLVDNVSQLFLYSFIVKSSAISLTEETYGWYQLTYQGNNRNPKVVVDRNNNLHIFWESSRPDITQLYYGVIGPSCISYSNSTLSSVADKQAEFLQKEIKPFDYMNKDILVPISFEMIELLDGHNPYYGKRGYLKNEWIKIIKREGTVDITSSDSVNITAKAVEDCAMAFMSMGPNNGFNIENPFSQINYQISFDLVFSVNQDKTTLDLSSYGNSLDDGELNDAYNSWKSRYSVIIDESLDNTPIYLSHDNKFIIGREDNIYDRFVPIVGTYQNRVLRDPSFTEHFQAIVSGTNKNLRHFMIGIMLEKSRFKAVNLQTAAEYREENNLTDNRGYEEEEIEEIYTGRAKLAVIYNTGNSFFDRDISHGIIRKVSDSFDISETNNFDIVINYFKMFNEDIANSLDVNKELVSTASRYSCSLSVFLNDTIKFSESFLVDISRDYSYFDVGFGIPSGGQFIADRFFPYDSSVYDSVNVVLNYTKIRISSPTYELNSEIANSSSFIGARLDLVVDDYIVDNPSGNANSFLDQYGRLPLGIDWPSTTDTIDESNFMQMPLTIEGFNKNVNLYMGSFNDIHITWQSNRSRYWDVYTSNGVDKNLPFRFDTQITATRSNSLMPSIAINDEGKRVIAWHDNRDGDYAIYCARALDIEKSGDDICRNNGLINYSPASILEFTRIVFNFFDSCITGRFFHFMLRFYGDINFTDLVTTISSEDNIVGWQYNGVDFSLEGVTGEETRQITYLPNDEDDVDGRVLYVKVTPLIQEE